MNPWLHISEAVEDGSQCELRFQDRFGFFDLEGPFFLYEGSWYQVEPPMPVRATPVAFRYFMVAA